jgi:hypothetical protein
MTNLGIAQFNTAFNGGEVAKPASTEKPLSKMNKAELEAACIAAGVSAEGTVKELRERLK